MKKRRRVNFTHVWVLVALLVVLVFGVTEGIMATNYYNTQAARHAKLTEVLNDRAQFEGRLSQETNTRSIEQEDYDSFMALAAADNAAAYDGLTQYAAEGVEIPDEVAEQLDSTNSKVDGVRYLDLWENQEIPAEYMTFLARDDDRYQFVADYTKLNGNTPEPGPLTEDLSEVPHLLQWDERWGYLPYGTSNLVIAGCAPTSLSMVFSYLNQDPSITPYAVAQYSEQNGDFVDGIGTAHDLMGDAANNWGIQFMSISPDVDTMKAELEAGNILVLSVVPGDFTRVGRFIVVTGLEDGQFKVLDPNSNKNTRLWDPQVVADQTAFAWAYWKDPEAEAAAQAAAEQAQAEADAAAQAADAGVQTEEVWIDETV